MNRDICGGCSSRNLHKFLDLGQTPLADNFVTNPTVKPKLYPLQLLVCTDCFLVQLSEIVPDEELFNAEYTFYSGASEPIQRYHAAYAKELINRFEQGRDLTVEIACNDGSLLQHFHNAGWKTLGVDPATGPAAIARDKGMEVITEPFNLDLAEEIRLERGRAGLIIANNVLAHVVDPKNFLAGVSRLLAPNGVVIMEVQYLGDLIAGNMFDHVYHEHRFYYSLTTLRRLFHQAGMVITGFRNTEPQGGSLRILAVRNGTDPYSQMTNENWLRRTETYMGFQGQINRVKDRLQQLIHAQHGRLAGYGATAKSTTLLNVCEINDTVLDYVVDTTPAKIGKYTPGTNIPIISPEREQVFGYPDAYLLLAWNYLGAILRRSDITSPNSTKWIVPIPMPVIL